MKIPVVKEWGSWAVFVSSVLTAIAAALSAQPQESGREFPVMTVLAVPGLACLINFKNPLTSALRTRGKRKEPLLWSLLFGLTGIVLLIPFLSEGIDEFAVFAVLVLTYAVLLYRGKEHHLFAELNGFALLTLSAPVIYFTITGDLSLKLYAAVFLFFGAGVFKVRVRTRKTAAYRWLMVLYCALAVIAYHLLDISTLILLPLVENIISVIVMKEERLKTTGYTELVKSILFVLLAGLLWKA